MSYFYDPRNIPRQNSYQVIPPGEYIAIIYKVERIEKEHNLTLRVSFKLQDESKGSITERFNIVHSNEVAQKISNQKFVSLLDCIGLGREPIKSEELLVGNAVKLEIDTKPHYRDIGELENIIKKYYPLTEDEFLTIPKVEKVNNHEKVLTADDLPF